LNLNIPLHPIIFIDIFEKKKRKITFEKHGKNLGKKYGNTENHQAIYQHAS